MWTHIGGYISDAAYVEIRKRTAALGITASTYFRGLIEADLKKPAPAGATGPDLSGAARRKTALAAYRLDTQRGAAMTKGGKR
jgi:hypothetical protein